MALDVEPPEPPTLSGDTVAGEYDDIDVQGTDYRREEITDHLHNGAWERAFNEWASHADVTVEEFEIALDLGMFSDFDFFWDSFAERVGFHAPGIPEDWRERELHSQLDSWNSVSAINAGLAELGQVVSSVLKEDYLEWESDFEAPDDLPDFSEDD